MATAQNTTSDDLRDYALAVPFDSTVFNFALASNDGSDLAAWDASSKVPLDFWLESYDPQVGKAVLWVKLANLPPGTSRGIWITSGVVPHCSALSSNGHGVFPFFSDVHDKDSWTTSGHLALSDTFTTGPFSVVDRHIIESDGTYNGSNSVVQATNGDWVLAYRKGTSHVDVPLIILRRSQDQGTTWGPEVVYFDTSGDDPSLVATPGGDLLLATDKLDQNALRGAAYARSVDNGLTWGPFTFYDQSVVNTFAFPTLFVNDGPTMYAASYGNSTFDATTSPFLWLSNDDGMTWSRLSELRAPGDPGTNETSISQVGPGSLFAVMRSADAHTTYGRFSTDMGETWGSLTDLTSQVGVIQLPQLIQVGPALVLLGREALDVLDAGLAGFPRQLVAFVSYNGGETFSYGTVLDTYTGLSIDGGYCWPMLRADGKVFVVYYADSNDLQKPDIKSLVLEVDTPQINPGSALHITSRFESGLATHSLDLSSTRYALEFRFRSQEIAAGSQFSVGLRADDGTGQSIDLVDWELPSTHATDPRVISGFMANNQFVPLLDSFAYNQTYRIRTIVDESQALQQGMVLDQFGNVLAQSSQEPLAQTSNGHASGVVVGNNSNLRATDTLLDFIFLRSAVEAEPQVVVSRIH